MHCKCDFIAILALIYISSDISFGFASRLYVSGGEIYILNVSIMLAA